MKTNIVLWLLILAASMAGCADEETLEPSGLDRDWFVIQDKPGELNHLIYEVYESTGISILINDTLGMEQRGVDAYGNPVIHYERFVLGYRVEDQKGDAKLVLSSDTSAMEETVRMLRDLVIPRLPATGDIRPRSFLIGDSLYLAEYGYCENVIRGFPGYVYKDLMGVVIGCMYEIGKIDELRKKFWAGMILAACAGNRIYIDSPDEIEDFYNVSVQSGTKTYHGSTAMYNPGINYKSTNPHYDWEPGEKGFLEYTVNGIELTTPGVLNKRYPSKELDAQYYIAAVYAWTEEEFESLYGAWPKCMEKYRMMKRIVEAYEAKEGKN